MLALHFIDNILIEDIFANVRENNNTQNIEAGRTAVALLSNMRSDSNSTRYLKIVFSHLRSGSHLVLNSLSN